MFSHQSADYLGAEQRIAQVIRSYPLPLNQSQLIKLQAHKSSFQAWKCVSFGCSLIAAILLVSKWHEVSTDLKLLNGINQLLVASSFGIGSGNQFIGPSSSLNSNSNSMNDNGLVDQLNATAATFGGQSSPSSPVISSWPPISLDEATLNSLGAGNSAPNSDESLPNSTLVSHMTLSLNRELNGNQLLRQEVEAFVAEFTNAKSTLHMSWLLVAAYLFSWILMILAINDRRISNDASLRNILLLSIFGAIDLAASAAFVMFRTIMYSIKNQPFVSQILRSDNFRDLPTRLSPDQLTAFTALRLVAMRSCSAYVDVYVSVIVASLTLLRLYSIVRALSYYRRLRRFNDQLTRSPPTHQGSSSAPHHFSGADLLTLDAHKSTYPLAANQPRVWHHQHHQSASGGGRPMTPPNEQPTYSLDSRNHQSNFMQPNYQHAAYQLASSPRGRQLRAMAATQANVAEPQLASASNSATGQQADTKVKVLPSEAATDDETLPVNSKLPAKQASQQVIPKLIQQTIERPAICMDPTGSGDDKARASRPSTKPLSREQAYKLLEVAANNIAQHRARLASSSQQEVDYESEPNQRQRGRTRRSSGGGNSHTGNPMGHFGTIGQHLPSNWQMRASHQANAHRLLHPETLLDPAQFDAALAAASVASASPRDLGSSTFGRRHSSQGPAQGASNIQHQATFTLLSAGQLEKLGRRLMAAGSAAVQAPGGASVAAAQASPLPSSGSKSASNHRGYRLVKASLSGDRLIDSNGQLKQPAKQQASRTTTSDLEAAAAATQLQANILASAAAAAAKSQAAARERREASILMGANSSQASTLSTESSTSAPTSGDDSELSMNAEQRVALQHQQQAKPKRRSRQQQAQVNSSAARLLGVRQTDEFVAAAAATAAAANSSGGGSNHNSLAHLATKINASPQQAKTIFDLAPSPSIAKNRDYLLGKSLDTDGYFSGSGFLQVDANSAPSSISGSNSIDSRRDEELPSIETYMFEPSIRPRRSKKSAPRPPPPLSLPHIDAGVH